MCGRFTLVIPPEMLAEIFGFPPAGDLAYRYNIAPSQQVLVVRDSVDGRRASFMRWGLIPSWAKDASMGARMINARSETVHEKPAFRGAVRGRRCIIPASGFFEWRDEGGKKFPLYARLKDGSPMGFAGIWDHWQDPAGGSVDSCSILTTTSNRLISPLHDRMPVILPPEAYALWLGPSTDPGSLKELYRPFPDAAMELYPVAPLVNNPRNDVPQCILPVGDS